MDGSTHQQFVALVKLGVSKTRPDALLVSNDLQNSNVVSFTQSRFSRSSLDQRGLLFHHQQSEVAADLILARQVVGVAAIWEQLPCHKCEVEQSYDQEHDA